jgi:hypothetical protein
LETKPLFAPKEQHDHVQIRSAEAHERDLIRQGLEEGIELGRRVHEGDPRPCGYPKLAGEGGFRSSRPWNDALLKRNLAGTDDL